MNDLLRGAFSLKMPEEEEKVNRLDSLYVGA